MKILKTLWIYVCAFFTVTFDGKASAGPMAIIKYGQIIAEARGKMGGMVFSRNHAGAYMRTKITPLNPQSIPQTIVRTLLTTLAQTWRGLTVSERLAWNITASTWVHTNIFGDNVPLSGFGLYCRLNRNLQTLGESLISVAPVHSAIVGVDSTSIVADTTLGTLFLTYAPVIPADQHLAIYATKPVSAGVTFVKSEYRFIAAFLTASASPYDLISFYTDVFGALPAIGEKVFVKAKPIMTATGQDGVAMAAQDIAV